MHSVLNTFFQGPVSGEEKKRRLLERIAGPSLLHNPFLFLRLISPTTAERAGRKDPSKYLLTVEQMVENDYPVPSYLADVFKAPDGWIETPEAPTDTKSEPESVYAIDCEMVRAFTMLTQYRILTKKNRPQCQTTDGKALTRICIIDYGTGKVVYDQFVKPPSPITDYLTRYVEEICPSFQLNHQYSFSGITEEALQSITTTLGDVQTYLGTIIAPSTILLGHSLESDLYALQLSHPRCIDTAILFHHPRGRPLKPGLAWLTRKWLGRTIQDRGPGGHDPEEDARACMDLLKAKIKNGASPPLPAKPKSRALADNFASH